MVTRVRNRALRRARRGRPIPNPTQRTPTNGPRSPSFSPTIHTNHGRPPTHHHHNEPQVYDTSPPLPRPLRSKFQNSLQYITAGGFHREARMIAPLDKGDMDKLKKYGMENARSLPSDGLIVRVTKRNVVFLRKVTEFELVHRELGNMYGRRIKRIETLLTLISGLLSVGLLLGDTLSKDQAEMMVQAVAILTLLMGVLKQWVTVAKYEEFEAKHSTSANGFMKLKEDITSLLATLSDSTKDEVTNNVTTGLTALSVEFLSKEGGSNAAAQAIQQMMPVIGGPSDGQVTDPDPQASSQDATFSDHLGPEGAWVRCPQYPAYVTVNRKTSLSLPTPPQRRTLKVNRRRS